MQKIAKFAVIIIITAIIVLSIYSATLYTPNRATQLSSKDFSVYKYFVPTGTYAGLEVLRLQYVGSEVLSGNLSIQAKTKDTGETVSGESFRVGIEPGWRTEIPVYKPSDAGVVITIKYNGVTIMLTA